MRFRQATATLIKQDNPIDLGVKVAPHRRAASATGAAMHNNHRQPLRIARLFHIDHMTIAHVQHPLVEGLDRRVEVVHCALLARIFVHVLPSLVATSK